MAKINLKKIGSFIREQNRDVEHLAEDLLIQYGFSIEDSNFRREIRRAEREARHDASRMAGTDDPRDLERIMVYDEIIDRAASAQINRICIEYGRLYSRLVNLSSAMRIRVAKSQKALQKQNRKIQRLMNQIGDYYSGQPDPDAPPEIFALAVQNTIEAAGDRRRRHSSPASTEPTEEVTQHEDQTNE